MRPRTRGVAWVLDNARLMGVLAVLGTGVTLIFAYALQNGVPLGGTYHVYVDVPDAAKLTKHADVRIGGARVGQVLQIDPQRRHGGRPFARLELGLDRGTSPLPVDTTAEVRLASVLGGKYVALVPGNSRRKVAERGGLPLAQGVPSVDVDDALRIFRPATRQSVRLAIQSLGDALAGRGSALNRTIGNLDSALPRLERVLRRVADPSTDLAGFLHGVALTSSAMSPVAVQAANLIGELDATVAGIDRADGALDAILEEAPPTERTLTSALVAARPTLDDAAAIARALKPAANDLPATARQLHLTARTAIPVTRATRTVARPLRKALTAVDRFSRSKASQKALRALGKNDLATFGGSAFVGLGAILQAGAEGQLHCNTFGLWARNLASTGSEGDAGGNWLRMVPVLKPSLMLHAGSPDSDLRINPYPNEDAQECESGNEPFDGAGLVGNPAGVQPAHVASTGAGR